MESIPPHIVALEWQYWPLQQAGLQTGLQNGWQAGLKFRAIGVVILAGLVWLVLLLSLPLLTALVLGLALAVSLLSYYLPTTYHVDATGVIVEQWLTLRRRKRTWSEFARCESYPRGYLLSPLAATSTQTRLATLRHLWLPNPPDEFSKQLLQAILAKNFPSDLVL
jgi:hypothetical protein